MSKYTKKKLDNWIKRTICTNCEHLRSEVWEVPDEFMSDDSEVQLVYTCDNDYGSELEKSKGKACKYFTEGSQEVLDYNKNVYDEYVQERFDENGDEIEDILSGQFDGDEIIGHR